MSLNDPVRVTAKEVQAFVAGLIAAGYRVRHVGVIEDHDPGDEHDTMRCARARWALSGNVIEKHSKDAE